MWANQQNLNANCSLDDITKSFFFLFKFDDAVVVMLKNKNKVFKKSFLNERYNYSGACGAHGRSE